MCKKLKIGIRLLISTSFVLLSYVVGLGQLSKNLPTDSSAVVFPDSSGIIYAVYQQRGHIYFSKSTDGGTNFRAGVKVCEDTAFQAWEGKPYFLVEGGQIFLAWIQKRISAEAGFIAHSVLSADGGQSFASGWSVTGTGKFRRPYRPKSTYSDSGKGVIINVMEIARRESLSPPPQRKPKVVPFMPVPENIPLAIIGDLDSDERRTTLDVAILLNGIFFDKPFQFRYPGSLCDVDINCDGVLTLADIVIELRAIFLSAPACFL